MISTYVYVVAELFINTNEMQITSCFFVLQ